MIVSALALAGCSSWFESPAKPANDAITTANGHLKTAMASDASVTASAASLDSIAYSVAGAHEALKLTAQIQSDIASEKREIEAAKASMDSISALSVPANFKSYAKLESAALATRVKVVDLQASLYTELEKVYSGLGTSTAVADRQQVLNGIESIKTEIDAASALATQQEKAASDYFSAQKLGG
jgi:hypothetical protein